MWGPETLFVFRRGGKPIQKANSSSSSANRLRVLSRAKSTLGETAQAPARPHSRWYQTVAGTKSVPADTFYPAELPTVCHYALETGTLLQRLAAEVLSRIINCEFPNRRFSDTSFAQCRQYIFADVSVVPIRALLDHLRHRL